MQAPKPRQSTDKDKPPSVGKARARADKEAVERDYRTGKYTLRELEAKHGVTNSTISRWAASLGWTKDLAQAIRQATNAKLIAAQTQHSCSSAQQNAAETVLVAAEVAANVILGHRSDLTRARATAISLLAELDGQALLAEESEMLAQILAGSGASPATEAQARAVVRKALDVGNRISAIKGMADALTKLHQGERVAFSLDDTTPPPKPPPAEIVTPEQAIDAYRHWISNA